MIAGIDEAGRGPLAGPVVAAAVVLCDTDPIAGLADSKVLSADARSHLATQIQRRAIGYGIGWADAGEIDTLNILQATFLAMRRALLAMPLQPRLLLIDGNRLPCLNGLGAVFAARAIVRGDATQSCISAASILAKTTRDLYMQQIHARYPSYEFDLHKGYPTPRHRKLLAQHGPCALHRRSFGPVSTAAAPLQSPP